MTTDMELLKDTVIEVQEKLKDNPEWIDRYDGYADLLIKNHDNLQKLARQFNRFEPLQFYIQVSKAKASDTNLFLDVRYMGQNVALLSSNKNGVFITTDSSKDKLIKTNERDFGFQDKLKKGTLWRSEEAARFRKFFKERPYVRNHEKGSKGNEEHNVESLLIGEFEKRNSGEKQLLFIQPIKYASHKLRFAMPTPITASNYHAVKYSKHRGGGIDILARTGSSHSRLCVIEVKDENLKEEPPTHALVAALGGNINGLERFAKTLYYGWGVPTNAENDQAAFELFKSVSENTDNRELLAEAFFFMADMICSDECTCKDYTLAASYAKIGMDLGDSSSTCLLGSLYLEGIGLDKDYSEAIRLFNLVYNRDKNPYAPYNLGEIFKEGLGVEIDIEQAMHWYSVASELGHPKAEKELKKICSC